MLVLALGWPARVVMKSRLEQGVYRRNRRHLKSAGTAGPNLATEEAIPDELPSRDDSAMVSTQPEGSTPAVSGDTTPADPELQRLGRAVRTPAWHQDHQIGYN